MGKELLEEIERLLGWKPEPREERSVSNLNEFPLHLIEAARRLPAVLQHFFLSYYFSVDNLKFLSVFIEEVVEGGQPVETWHRGRILVPSFSIRTLVQLSVQEIIAPLVPSPSEQFHRLRPRRENWDAGEFLTGAPALIRRDIDYRHSTPEGAIGIATEGTELDPVADYRVAARRWIASGLAGAAKRRNLQNIHNPTDLINRCFPEIKSISQDATIAARGLIRELNTLPEDNDTIPGFRGPDNWYESN